MVEYADTLALDAGLLVAAQALRRSFDPRKEPRRPR